MGASSLAIGFATAKSRHRPSNEDSVAYLRPKAYWQATSFGSIFAVADGVGSKPLAAEASRLATQSVIRGYYRVPANRATYRLLRSLSEANRTLIQSSRRKRLPQHMSSTAVAAVIRDTRLWVSNVGDSRCYLVRRGKARLLSRDHTFVEEGIRRKMFTRAEARSHPMRSTLMQALGMRERVTPALAREKWKVGDTLLLCTDGLSDFVSGHEIAHALSAFPPKRAAQVLVDMAQRRRTRDDCTALVVKSVARVGRRPTPRHVPAAVPVAQSRSKIDLPTALGGLLLLFAVLGVVLLALLSG